MKLTGAERQARYREKKRGEGSYNAGRGGKNSKWDTGSFIAIDGEGESTGDAESFTVPGTGKKYEARPHSYTFLGASTGESLYNAGKRLDTFDCINFLCDLANAHKRDIFVIFAGGYDVNHFLMFGFERDKLKEIASGSATRFVHGGIDYEIEYRNRKSFTVRRGLSFKKNSKNKWCPVWASRIVLWDVFGFFQENFIGVIGKWLGKNHRHYELIKKMKALRGDFEHVSQSEINAYNAAELECLTELMEKVRAAVDGLELKLNRWDGAGSIAAALMKKHNIKEFKNDTPPHLVEAVSTAYAGGRIEVCKIGSHNATVWDYDINSAYPSVMAKVPCLAHGIWTRGTSEIPPPGLTLVHCSFKFQEKLPFYPLFYRTEHMEICFPSRGEGIYWYPEYEAALLCPGIIDIIEWWHFEPACHHEPFHWIKDYYTTRQQWVKNPLEEWQRGGEKIIKLGLNSLYGKSAQQLGGRADRAPAYHQMEWAGYITSSTRARLFTAAMQNPDAVIGFATDGIFTTAPLPFSHSLEKTMGEWDVKEFDGLTLAMAGVYWWHDKKEGFKHFSRGFDKDSMKSPELVIDAWKNGKKELDIKMHRLIGLGSACVSDTFYAMRGRFTDGMRTLDLSGESFKRVGIKSNAKPWKQLCPTLPNFNHVYENGLQKCSFPYPLEWQKNEEFQNELEQEAENIDTENI